MADNPIDIQALARGDEKAFQALFVEYYPALVSFGCRYVVSKETAEDIVQDVFVRIWETKESLAKIEDLSAYLYQMVRFRCFNHLRDAKTHSDALRDYAENMPTEDMNNYIKEESFRLAMKALEDLPPASRQVFSHMLDDGEIKLSDIMKETVCRDACRAAIKGGEHLTKRQIEYVLAHFMDANGDLPQKCPHGRPAVVALTKRDFEKMFRRTV